MPKPGLTSLPPLRALPSTDLGMPARGFQCGCQLVLLGGQYGHAAGELPASHSVCEAIVATVYGSRPTFAEMVTFLAWPHVLSYFLNSPVQPKCRVVLADGPDETRNRPLRRCIIMSQKKQIRKHIFVDAKVQGALVLRVAMYWVFCLLSLSLMLLCWRIFTGPARLFYTHFADMWYYYGPALVASFLLLPIVLVDIVRVSNRFAGPLVRLRRSMRALARGEEVQPIHFRGRDFWQEFADEFNAIAARLQDDKARTPPNTGPSESAEEGQPVATAAE